MFYRGFYEKYLDELYFNFVVNQDMDVISQKVSEYMGKFYRFAKWTKNKQYFKMHWFTEKNEDEIVKSWMEKQMKNILCITNREILKHIEFLENWQEIICVLKLYSDNEKVKNVWKKYRIWHTWLQ